MTAAEEGVLLLCCRLGDPDSKPLSMAQFRELGLRVRASRMDGSPLADLTQHQLEALGYNDAQARQILGLLDRQTQLHHYLSQGQRLGIEAVTRISPAYPRRVTLQQKLSATPVLFTLGDLSLLDRPSVAVIGSRKLFPENEAFAQRAGRLAAEEGLVLVSGNAPGADQTAQNACLEAGGSCIIIAADRLMDHTMHERILYISEDGYDLSFSPFRALHRNALIHIQGDRTLAVQCSYGKGGTWEGCLDNLRHGWSPLFVFDDGTQGTRALIERSATGIKQLTSISALTPAQVSLF